jgi:pSer/pThr/pTyr-binding forkhead associated (FHA) protein
MSSGSGQLRLEVISGNATGSTIEVEDELVIGRHATGAGRLDADEEISRQHARISREATGDYAIEDLGSSNGTFVNGLRIQSPRLLEVGDSIEAGATTLVVREIVLPQPTDAGRTVLSATPVAPANLTVLAPVPKAPASPSAPPPLPVESTGPSAPPPLAVESTSPGAPPSPAAEAPDQDPPLALSLEIDFDAREARIALGDSGETVRMIFEDGRWRTAPGGA